MAKKTYVENAAAKFMKTYLGPNIESIHRIQLYDLLLAFGLRIQRQTRRQERAKKTSQIVKDMFKLPEGSE